MKAVAFHTAILCLIACFTLAQENPTETTSPDSPKAIKTRKERKKVAKESTPAAATVVDAVPEGAQAAEPEKIVKDVFPRFSILGDWLMTHPQWTDVATFHQDGAITTKRQKTAGRWFLAGDGGTPLIVIRWDLFGTESVSMVDLDHFRGQARNGRFIDMRREGAAGE